MLKNLIKGVPMHYKDYKQALDQMEMTGSGWVKLSNGKVVTRRNCEEFIRNMNNNSPEDFIDQARRDA